MRSDLNGQLFARRYRPYRYALRMATRPYRRLVQVRRLATVVGCHTFRVTGLINDLTNVTSFKSRNAPPKPPGFTKATVMTSASLAPRTRKHQICSYDMVEAPSNCYVLLDEGGPMYFCNERCLGLWAATFATHPNRKKTETAVAIDVTAPGGQRRRFADALELAQWSSANLLKGEDNPWLEKGTVLSD